MNRLTLVAVVALCAIAACRQATTHTSEEALVPGPFAAIEGARLGAAVWFENDIDSRTCFPLEISGRTETWLTRAYKTADWIVVRRCELGEGDHRAAENRREGWAKPVWERMSAAPNGNLQFTPLDLPRWTFIANPTFCDALVAYWGIDDGDGYYSILRPTVFDLERAVVVHVGTTGPVELRTDWEGFLDVPIWNAACTAVVFDGEAIGKPSATFTVG